MQNIRNPNDMNAFMQSLSLKPARLSRPTPAAAWKPWKNPSDNLKTGLSLAAIFMVAGLLLFGIASMITHGRAIQTTEAGAP